MEVEKAGADVFRVTGRVDDPSRARRAAGASIRSRLPVDCTFELRYVPQAETADEEEREIAEDDLTTAFYRMARSISWSCCASSSSSRCR